MESAEPWRAGKNLKLRSIAIVLHSTWISFEIVTTHCGVQSSPVIIEHVGWLTVTLEYTAVWMRDIASWLLAVVFEASQKTKAGIMMNYWIMFFLLMQFSGHTRLEAMAGLTEEMKQLPETENWRRGGHHGVMMFYANLHGCSGCTFLRFFCFLHFDVKPLLNTLNRRAGFRRGVPLQNNHRPVSTIRMRIGIAWNGLKWMLQMFQKNSGAYHERRFGALYFSNYSWSEPSCLHQIEVCIVHEPFLCCRGATLENSEYLAAKADPLISVISAQSSTSMWRALIACHLAIHHK